MPATMGHRWNNAIWLDVVGLDTTVSLQHIVYVHGYDFMNLTI
jgi:hypothetical protein